MARASLLLSFLLALFALPSVTDASTSVPTLSTFELIERPSTSKEISTENTEVALSTFGEDGGSLQRLLAGRLEAGGLLPDFLGGLSFSPDASQIAFTAEAKAEDPRSRAIYVIDSDGTDLRRLPGTHGGAQPLFAPDGKTLAFTRSKFRSPRIDLEKLPPIRGKGYSSTTTWLSDLPSGKDRRLTPWHNGLAMTPGSFSPDGRTLALTRADEHRGGPEVILRPLTGGPARVLTELGEEPAFSPDGRKVAFVGYQDAVRIKAEENQDYAIGELYSIDVDGKGLRRLTDNKAIETSPAWNPSGTRIAYVEARPDHSWLAGLANLFPTGNRIREMNADGSCPKTIRSAPKVALYRVAWRPGCEAAPSRLGC